jgi:phytoene/squalene synthetase
VAQDTTKQPTGLELYTRASERAAAEVIAAYSTSFGFATRLLSPEIRRHVRNIYALVRVADEIVDGSAEDARVAGGDLEPARVLDELEAETYAAMASGFSSNIVVHAFAVTARTTGIEREIVAPFFESMRMDLNPVEYDRPLFEKYIYGSAEVVGLMCLRAFVHGLDYTDEQHETMIAGARALGSAFQKVNFLRDWTADHDKLGRSYFPGVSRSNFNDSIKASLVAEIDGELVTAAKCLPLLPKGASRAVAAALLLFRALNQRIDRAPASLLFEERIRVPDWQKLFIVARAWIGVMPR